MTLQSVMEFPGKAEKTIVMVSLKKEALEQLHLNHMGIEKTRLLVHNSIYLVNMNDDIKEAI